MTLPAIPSVQPDWATQTNYNAGARPWNGQQNKTAPSGGVISEGFEPENYLAADFLNFLLNNTGNWIKYVRDRSTVFNVADYGAVGDGTTDDTAAIQAAITALEAVGQGVLFFPSATYLVTDTLLIANNGVQVLGNGVYATTILFHPTSDKPCFKFSAGASIQYGCSIKGFLFLGAGTHQKIAITVWDNSNFTCEDVWVDPTNSSTWIGTTSIGLQLKGRQMTKINRFVAFCDLPINIAMNPNIHTTVNCDHLHISGTYLRPTPSSGNACIAVDDGIFISNFLIDGDNAWIIDKYGFHWVDTNTVNPGSYGSSYKLEFAGTIRMEQAVDATGYGIYIDHKVGLQDISLKGVYFTVEQNGAKLFGVQRATIEDCTFPTNSVSRYHLSMDVGQSGTVGPLVLALKNNVVQTTTLTNLVGLTKVWAMPNQSGASQTMPCTGHFVDNTTALNIHALLAGYLGVNTDVGSGLSTIYCQHALNTVGYLFDQANAQNGTLAAWLHQGNVRHRLESLGSFLSKNGVFDSLSSGDSGSLVAWLGANFATIVKLGGPATTDLLIGDASATPNLKHQGSMILPVHNIGDAPYGVVNGDQYLLLTVPLTADRLISLPVAPPPGRYVVIKNFTGVSTHNLIIEGGNAGDRIDGQLTITMSNANGYGPAGYESIRVIYQGGGFWAIV